MSKNTDPAFPVSRQASASGITIRDYFAAAALPGLIQVEMGTYQNEAAMQITVSKAYEMADMMMGERKP